MTGPTTPAGWDTAHYTPQQIAEMLQVSVDTVRGIFAEMDGVVRIERPRPNRRARPYVTLRIPVGTFDLWYRKNSGGWREEVESRRRRVQKALVGRNERRVMPLRGLDGGVA